MRTTIYQATRFLSDVADAARRLAGRRLTTEWVCLADLWRRASFSAWGATPAVKARELRGIGRECARFSRVYAATGHPFDARVAAYYRACALVLLSVRA